LLIYENSYLSFVDNWLIDELEDSTKIVTNYIIEKRMKKEATEIAKRKEKVEIAKTMKKADEPVEKIVTFIGLTGEEIEKLRVRK
jgi:DNA repair protein RadC